MIKNSPRLSATRRNAEALLTTAQKRESDFKLEQERVQEAMALKTARLRELRLAKEAADGLKSLPSRLSGRGRKFGALGRDNPSGKG
jgi:hypothetical protein